MPAFELDSAMLKKLDKIASLCFTLNTMENNQAKISLQINHERMILCAHKFGDWDFPIYTFQQHFVSLSYPMLDAVIEEINYMIKYPYKS